MRRYIKRIFTGKFSFILVVIPVLSACSGPSGAMRTEHLERDKSRIMTQWDLNRDGKITCADALQKQKQLFIRADLDGSGTLEVEEFKQASWSNPAFAEEHLYLFDVNHNGNVSLKEFEERPNQKFLRMDKNRDCKISDKEIAAMLSGGKGQRPDRRSRGGKKGEGKGGRHGGPSVTEAA